MNPIDRIDLEFVCGCGQAYNLMIAKAAVPVEPPAEVPHIRRVFPAGVGPWKYERIPEEMKIWMEANGLTWGQFWSGDWKSRGFPSIWEAKTGAWGLASCQRMAKYQFETAGSFGVNIDCEVGWTERSTEFAQWVKATYPDKVRLSGPLWHMPEPADPRWINTDAVMTFYRVSGPDRFPEDIWYVLGLGEALGKPYCIGVQPQVSDNPLTFAPADEFAAALEIAAYADGLTLWAADRLWKYHLGLVTPINPQEYEGIMAAVKNVNQERLELPRKYVLYPTDTFENGQPYTTKRLNYARCLGRIVGGAGYLPVFTTDETLAEISWDTLDKPEGYGLAVFFLYDTGHPSRPEDIKETVRQFEITISGSL